MTVARRPRRNWEPYRFAVVGGAGFATDAIVLTLLMKSGQSILLSRVCSFACASFATWWMHRAFTFADRAGDGGTKASQYVRYVTVQVCGAASNLLVFYVVIRVVPWLAAWPVIPLAIGAVAGLVVNYLGSSRWAFKMRFDHE